MNEEYQHRIDRYLGNEMSSKERSDFENEIEVNTELRDQLDFIRSTTEAIKVKDFGVKLDFIKGLEGAEIQENRAKNSHRMLYLLGSIAASILLLVSLFWFNPDESSKEQLFDEHFFYYPQGFVRRGGADELQEGIRTAYTYYEERDMENAIPALIKLVEAGHEESEYYLAICLLKANREDEAIKLFEKLLPVAVGKKKQIETYRCLCSLREKGIAFYNNCIKQI